MIDPRKLFFKALSELAQKFDVTQISKQQLSILQKTGFLEMNKQSASNFASKLKKRMTNTVRFLFFIPSYNFIHTKVENAFFSYYPMAIKEAVVAEVECNIQSEC